MKQKSFTFFIYIVALLFVPFLSSAGTNAKNEVKNDRKHSDPSSVSSTSKAKSGFYNWLVKEMFEQVFLRTPLPKAEVVGWSNVLLQGGSVEGVYHGLILSTEYSKMENGNATLKAIRFFSEEMALLSGEKNKSLTERIVKENMRSSIFTLKRILGEKILSEIEKMKSDRGKLADWYAATVVRWAKLDISFGMSQRNIRDIDFHKKWSEENTIGLNQWELLNRTHRILNDYNGLVISPAGK